MTDKDNEENEEQEVSLEPGETAIVIDNNGDFQVYSRAAPNAGRAELPESFALAAGIIDLMDKRLYQLAEVVGDIARAREEARLRKLVGSCDVERAH